MCRTISKQQARRFLLAKHGLSGAYKFKGKQGVLQFVRQCGCVQFDPIDVCGKNAELVLQSRVAGFRKEMLPQLLYQERRLVDYFDKNLAIILREDWPYYARTRAHYRDWVADRQELHDVAQATLDEIATRGPLASRDLPWQEKVLWPWGATRLSRASLESLYFQGRLIIHHKQGTNKYYALPEGHLPAELLAADDPCPDIVSHYCWRVKNRIGAVGLLWNRASDAWLGFPDFTAAIREQVFAALLAEGSITELCVEEVAYPLYCLSADLPLLEQVCTQRQAKARTELIAPLDSLIWDRNLIQALFGFAYKWEIYTPQAQRKYGYYVLPLLQGERFTGRVELRAHYAEQRLELLHLWWEPDVKANQRLQDGFADCVERFARFHDCTEIDWGTEIHV